MNFSCVPPLAKELWQIGPARNCGGEEPRRRRSWLRGPSAPRSRKNICAKLGGRQLGGKRKISLASESSKTPTRATPPRE
eukprot:11618082-Alexandrium_andersonii.AAC.1